MYLVNFFVFGELFGSVLFCFAYVVELLCIFCLF